MFNEQDIPDEVRDSLPKPHEYIVWHGDSESFCQRYFRLINGLLKSLMKFVLTLKPSSSRSKELDEIHLDSARRPSKVSGLVTRMFNEKDIPDEVRDSLPKPHEYIVWRGDSESFCQRYFRLIKGLLKSLMKFVLTLKPSTSRSKELDEIHLDSARRSSKVSGLVTRMFNEKYIPDELRLSLPKPHEHIVWHGDSESFCQRYFRFITGLLKSLMQFVSTLKPILQLQCSSSRPKELSARRSSKVSGLVTRMFNEQDIPDDVRLSLPKPHECIEWHGDSESFCQRYFRFIKGLLKSLMQFVLTLKPSTSRPKELSARRSSTVSGLVTRMFNEQDIPDEVRDSLPKPHEHIVWRGDSESFCHRYFELIVMIPQIIMGTVTRIQAESMRRQRRRRRRLRKLGIDPDDCNESKDTFLAILIILVGFCLLYALF